MSQVPCHLKINLIKKFQSDKVVDLIMEGLLSSEPTPSIFKTLVSY